MKIFLPNKILIILFFIALLAYVLMPTVKNKLSPDKYTNISDRIKTWVKIIFILYFACLNKITLLILFSFISYISLGEFINVFKIEKNKQLQIFFILMIIGNYFFIYRNSFIGFLIFTPSLLFIMTFFRKYKKEVFFGGAISVYLLSFLTFLINSDNGITKIITYIILVELNDIYQYITGNIFGMHTIAPKISPNKTLEGVIGGVILTTLTAIILKYYYWNDLYILVSSIIALLGFFGDIFISYFKRIGNIKDTGNLLKGHGGVLDRIDSLIFVSPFVCLVNLFL